MQRILVINTGSTSTKIAVFENGVSVYDENINHPADQLKACPTMLDQYPLRYEAIRSRLEERGLLVDGFAAVAARGGTIGMANGGA